MEHHARLAQEAEDAYLPIFEPMDCPEKQLLAILRIAKGRAGAQRQGGGGGGAVEAAMGHGGDGAACAACGKGGVALKTCSRCHAVKYCSRECQLKDYRAGHKRVCASSFSG